MEIALGELACSNMKTIEDEKKFTKKVEETTKARIEETIDWLKKKNSMPVGIRQQSIHEKSAFVEAVETGLG